MDIAAILPNHGDPTRIAAGGYGPGLIGTTDAYVRRLLSCTGDAGLAAQSLSDFVAAETATGDVIYHPVYAAVHTRNVEAILATRHGG